MIQNTRVSIIAAIGKNRELGKEDRLLWEIPEDAKFFRDMTRGHVNIMGRKTYESLLHYYKGKPMPKRVSVVVTRDAKYKAADGVFVFTDMKEAVEFAKKKEQEISKIEEYKNARDLRSLEAEVYDIGGGQIYALGLPFADRLYLTFVDGEFPQADAFFPEFPEFTKVVGEKKGLKGEYDYTFKTLERG
ncbi:MAG: dihydrofolate reductase [Candidatus Levybacteria bacterium]|nr:dihydrofolate reductase [Candidatus Levybacteria bacterium]